MGRADRVFPLIIAGYLTSDGTDVAAERFKLGRHAVDTTGVVTERRVEPLAADARPGKDGWTTLAWRLIAGIQRGVRRSDAAKRRQRRRRAGAR